MRKTMTLIAACTLVSGIAAAQMKKAVPQPAPAPATPNSSPIRVTGANGQEATMENVGRVTPSEALKLQQKGVAVIVDVRSNGQFELGHIKDAFSIPNSQLIARLRELPAGKQIITYCACSAEQTAARAVLELKAHGVKNAVALKGGWNLWKAEGLPTAKGKT